MIDRNATSLKNTEGYGYEEPKGEFRANRVVTNEERAAPLDEFPRRFVQMSRIRRVPNASARLN